MSDQHRGDCVGADGNKAVETPAMDRLAREGVRFRSAYSSTPTCTPARACLLTGMSPWNHGMLGCSRVAEKYPVEMPRLLAEAGYHTMAIGKLHYHPQRNLHGYHAALLDESSREQTIDFRSDYRAWFWSEAPNLHPDATGVGFNDYKGRPYVLPERLHPTRWTGDCAVRFLQTYKRTEPFFLKVSFARPHSPYDPPQSWWKRYEEADLPKPYAAPWAARYTDRNSDRDDIWRGKVDPAEERMARQGYYGSVSFVDQQIERIGEALENRGLLDQTLIVYTSDHGDMTGDHNLWRKSYAYEPSARVPILMRWPEGLVSKRRGQVMDQPVELRDILATFLDAAGKEAPRKIDGASLLELVRSGGANWRPWIDLEHDITYDRVNHWSALTDGRMKYIFHALDGEEQLFDLRRDPREMTDLASNPRREQDLRTWRNRLIEHLAPRGEAWVKGGRLALRPESIRHSPNYPG